MSFLPCLGWTGPAVVPSERDLLAGLALAKWRQMIMLCFFVVHSGRAVERAFVYDIPCMENGRAYGEESEEEREQ